MNAEKVKNEIRKFQEGKDFQVSYENNGKKEIYKIFSSELKKICRKIYHNEKMGDFSNDNYWRIFFSLDSYSESYEVKNDHDYDIFIVSNDISENRKRIEEAKQKHETEEILNRIQKDNRKWFKEWKVNSKILPDPISKTEINEKCPICGKKFEIENGDFTLVKSSITGKDYFCYECWEKESKKRENDQNQRSKKDKQNSEIKDKQQELQSLKNKIKSETNSSERQKLENKAKDLEKELNKLEEGNNKSLLSGKFSYIFLGAIVISLIGIFLIIRQKRRKKITKKN